MGHPGQGKRQPGEQDRSRDKKVRYSFCWSIENRFVCLYQFLHGFLVAKFSLKYFVIIKESCFEINFLAIILDISNILQMFIVGVLITFIA